MVDYMNARGKCPDCGEFQGWADGPPHKCTPIALKENIEEIINIHKRVAKRWGCYTLEDNLFLALGAAGEVGEVANVVKKVYRGDNIQPRSLLLEEIGDTIVYLALLADSYGFSIDTAVQSIMPKVREKFK